MFEGSWFTPGPFLFWEAPGQTLCRRAVSRIGARMRVRDARWGAAHLRVAALATAAWGAANRAIFHATGSDYRPLAEPIARAAENRVALKLGAIKTGGNRESRAFNASGQDGW